MKRNENRELLAFAIWLFTSLMVGPLIIHIVFPNAPFSEGPPAAPIAMPALYFGMMLGMGIFGVGLFVAGRYGAKLL